MLAPTKDEIAERVEDQSPVAALHRLWLVRMRTGDNVRAGIDQRVTNGALVFRWIVAARDAPVAVHNERIDRRSQGTHRINRAFQLILVRPGANDRRHAGHLDETWIWLVRGVGLDGRHTGR